MGKLITMDGNEPVITDCAHPNDAGFTVGNVGPAKHKCGQFATFAKKEYRNPATRILQYLSVYRCKRCGITWIADPDPRF